MLTFFIGAILQSICFVIPAYHWETILNYAKTDPISEGDASGKRKQRKSVKQREEQLTKNKLVRDKANNSNSQRHFASESAKGKSKVVNF